ncbi:MAG: hypothetical protein PHX68_03925 [Alphaproteobacteria bacterium]|nr:hypothetical protein [Alphaproteobacteria bacterium]
MQNTPWTEKEIGYVRADIKDHPHWADRRRILESLTLPRLRDVMCADEMKGVFSGVVVFDVLRGKFRKLAAEKEADAAGYAVGTAAYRKMLSWLNEPGNLSGSQDSHLFRNPRAGR